MTNPHRTLRAHRPQEPLTGSWFNYALALLTLLVVLGCQSDKPASASFASVSISGCTEKQIRETTIAVFRADGFTPVAFKPNLVFEKEGTHADNLAYNGIFDTQAGASTHVRVKTELVDFGNGTQRLQCQAFIVSGTGGTFFEDEHRLSNFRRKPYQKLLDEVSKQLKQP